MIKNKVAVLISTYNNETTITSTIKEIKKYLPNSSIYLYDNNSHDLTLSIAKKYGINAKTIFKPGKKNIIKTMFKEVDADLYLLVSGSGTYSLENVKKMLLLILEGKADMVIANRMENIVFLESKKTKFTKSLINMLFNSKIDDFQSECRALSKDFVKSYLSNTSLNVDLDMTLFAISQNMLIKELPTTYRKRRQNKISLFKTIFTILKTYKAKLLFNLLSLIFYIISAIIAIPLLINSIKTGDVIKYSSLVLCCTSFILANMFIITSFIISYIKEGSSH